MTTPPPEEEDRTILPSANTPEPEYEPGDIRPNPAPIPPRPEGSRVNPHGIRRSPTPFSASSAPRPGNGPAWSKPNQPGWNGAAPGYPQQGQQPGPQASQGSMGQQAGPPHMPQYGHGNDSHGNQQRGQIGWQQHQPARAGASGQNMVGMPYPNSPHYATDNSATSAIGVFGGVMALAGGFMAALMPFLPLIELPTASVKLWGAATGSANSYIIFAVALLGIIGAVMMLTSTRKPKSSLMGGSVAVVAGVIAGGMETYFVTNSSHRAQVAQGSTFGVGVWLLIAATCVLLVGGILGIVRGTSK